MKRPLSLFAILLVALGCPPEPTPNNPEPTPTPTPTPSDRKPAVAADDPLFGRVEGTGFANDCKADGDCKKGGCSSEVCSAASDVVTTCEMPTQGFPPGPGAECGCVQSQCIWYRTGDEGGGAQAGAKQGEKCDDGKCAEGLTCVDYYGIAGPSGPKFTSCEIPCPGGKPPCPEGQSCITIADGPGQVCRAPS